MANTGEDQRWFSNAALIAIPVLVLVASLLILYQEQISRAPLITADARNVQTFECPTAFYSDGALVEHSFDYYNLTEHPISIDDVNCSCSCTQAEVSNKKVLPGESTSINMAMQVKGNKRRQSTHCIVTDSLGNHRAFRLVVNTLNRIDLHGSNAAGMELNLGQVFAGEKKTHELALALSSLNGEDDEAIQIASISAEKMSVELTDLGPKESIGKLGKREYAMIVSLDDMELGSWSQPIEIRLSNSELHRITVNWTMSPQLKIQPSRLFFAVSRQSKESVEQLVRISALKQQQFELFRPTASQPAIRVSQMRTSSKDSDRELEVRVDLEKVPKLPFFGEVSIETSLRSQPSVVIPVTLVEARSEDDGSLP